MHASAARRAMPLNAAPSLLESDRFTPHVVPRLHACGRGPWEIAACATRRGRTRRRSSRGRRGAHSGASLAYLLNKPGAPMAFIARNFANLVAIIFGLTAAVAAGVTFALIR